MLIRAITLLGGAVGFIVGVATQDVPLAIFAGAAKGLGVVLLVLQLVYVRRRQ